MIVIHNLFENDIVELDEHDIEKLKAGEALHGAGIRVELRRDTPEQSLAKVRVFQDALKKAGCQ